MQSYSLLDGAIRVDVDAQAAPQVSTWLPLGAAEWNGSPAQIRLVIHGGSTPEGVALTSLKPVATMAGAVVHISGDDAWIVAPGMAGTLNLADGSGDFVLDRPSVVDVAAGLSFGIALLLARARRYLLHCAAVQAGDGGVWLIAGDSGAGKSTTAVSLARAGWALLADDHVVLDRAHGRWRVHGWLRALHLDGGWPAGTHTGIRTAVDARTIGLQLASAGPLRGILLPRVRRDAVSTKISAASRSDALAMLLRQGAWNVADGAVAGVVLADLGAVVQVPCYSLELATDTYENARLLRELVETRCLNSIQEVSG